MINIQSQGQEWEVEKILQRGRFKNITHYLILWKGFSADQATWEPITNLQHCQQAIIDFEKGLRTMNKDTPTDKKERKKRINFDNIFKPLEDSHISAVKIEGNPIQPEVNEAPQNIALKDFTSQLSKNSTEPDSKLHEIYSSTIEGTNLVQIKNIKEHIQAIPEVSIHPKEIIDEDLCQKGLLRKKIKLNQHEEIKQSAMNLQEHSKEPTTFMRERQFFNDKMSSKKITSNTLLTNQKDDSQTVKKITPPTESTKQKPQTQFKPLPVKEVSKVEKIATPKNLKYLETLSIDVSRYNLCDNELQFQQKECLMNILRKKTGEKRMKPLIKLVDISNKEDLLSVISGLKLIVTSSNLEYLDLLIKVRYGWMAVGRTMDSEYIMIDVNLIKQESWNSLKKYLSKD